MLKKNYDLVIDVGSSNTVIYKDPIGVVLKEPTCALIEKLGRSEIVTAVGLDVLNRKIIDSNTQKLVYPIEKGIIKDKVLLNTIVNEFLKKINDKKLFKMNKLLYCINNNLTSAEKKECKNFAYSLNVTKVKLVPSTIFAYIDSVFEKKIDTKLIVNMGGGLIDISIIYDTKILSGCSLNIGSADLNNDIKSYIYGKYGVIISDIQAENVKKELGTLLPNDIVKFGVTGLDKNFGKEKTINLSSTELLPIFIEFFEKVCNAIILTLENSDKSIVKEIKKGGIYFCGGLSNITGIERFFGARLNYPIQISPDPDLSIVNGIKYMFLSTELINKIENCDID